MTTPNTITAEPIDPAWALPPSPTRGCPVSAATFARLLAAAREGGWPGVWRTWAEDETVVEADGRQRPARRRTLGTFLEERRPDLRAVLDDAANQKRDRLLNELENEVERIALGPGDVTTDLRADGSVARTRVDRRNKLYAILQLLKAHDRDRYGDHRRVTVDGQIDHTARLEAHAGFTIKPDEIQALPADRAALLLDLLTEIEEARHEQRTSEPRTVRMLPPQPARGAGASEAEGGPPLDAG